MQFCYLFYLLYSHICMEAYEYFRWYFFFICIANNFWLWKLFFKINLSSSTVWMGNKEEAYKLLKFDESETLDATFVFKYMYRIKVFQGSLTGITCRSVVLWLEWGGGSLFFLKISLLIWFDLLSAKVVYWRTNWKVHIHAGKNV